MALFDEALIAEIGQQVRQRQQVLSLALGETPAQADALDTSSPLYQDLALLIEIANGEVLRTEASALVLARVEAALQRLLDLLFGNVRQTHVSIPDDFWQTDMGILVSRVRWWLSADDLITISNAAALAFGENTQANRMRIARAMERGTLMWIPDPSVANPQQNRRVLRSQVERLRAQNTLPG